MNKKEYILKLLDKFMDTREPAKGIKLLVESNTIDEKTIDQLYNTFSDAVDSMTETAGKEKLEKAKVFLDKLKTVEAESIKQDSEDLAELDNMLQNI